MEQVNKTSVINKGKKDLEPMLILHFCIKLIKKLIYLLVGDYFAEDWKMNLFVVNLLFIVFSSLFCYLFQGYQYRHDLKEVICTTCLIMFSVIGVQRCHMILTKHHYAVKIFKDVHEYTSKWEHTEVGYPILVWYFRLLRTLFIVGLGGFLSFAVALVLFPIVMYLLTEQCRIAFELYIPMIDHESHPGFEIHLFYHFFCIVCGACGVGACTFCILLFFVSIFTRIDILIARISQLQNSILSKGKKNPDITQTLSKIYEDHQNLIAFLDELEDQLSYQHLTDHMIFGFQICTALAICMNRIDWLIGYYIVFSDTFVIFTLDLIGTLIQIKLEKLSAEVYNIPWYLMSIKNQKDFNFFMAHTQNCERLTLWGRIPLNLDTFVRLYKGIYSYLMVLRKVNI